jgi:histidinol phosphatase-like PHP family hydrolase
VFRRGCGELRLDADLHVTVRGPAELAAAMARAAARGLTDLGITAHARPDADWFDAYVEMVRAAGALARTRIHCGLELTLFGPDGRIDLSPSIHTRLSRVDYVVLMPAVAGNWHDGSGRPGPEQRAQAMTLAALRAAAGLPVPVVLAAPFPDEAGADPETIRALGWACARAGVAIEVTERHRGPSIAVATTLAGAGATLVAGSGARSAADVGRYDHVRAVAEALGPEPQPS